MSLMPCPNRINECECQDDPISNFSSEDLDPNVFCANVTFSSPPLLGICDGGAGFTSSAWCCSEISFEDAYLCALRKAQEKLWSDWLTGSCPPPGCPPNCPIGCPPICPPTCPPNCSHFGNSEQTCTKECLDGSTKSFTIPANTFFALSQFDADKFAYDIACANVSILCNGGDLFFNTSQTCTKTCADGSVASVTITAGTVVSNVNQADADALAYSFACSAVVLICVEHVTLYYNTDQSCAVKCQNGSEFNYTVAAGKIVALSQLEADNIAHSLACRLAKTNRICITTSALAGTCINEAYSATLHASGGTPWFVDAVTVTQIPIIECAGINFGSTFPYVWTIVSGSLPPGLVLNPCSGVINGTPTSHGVYTFTVKATDQNGGHQQKSLSICVVEITDDATLPPATIGTSYLLHLNQEPGSAPTEVWTLVSGTMPAGLTLAADGTIGGTPTGPAQSVNLVIQVEVECA